jgi:hypothetical protein
MQLTAFFRCLLNEKLSLLYFRSLEEQSVLYLTVEFPTCYYTFLTLILVEEKEVNYMAVQVEAPRKRIVTVTTVRRNYAHPDLLQTGVVTREEIVGDTLVSKKRIGTIDFGQRRERPRSPQS